MPNEPIEVVALEYGRFILNFSALESAVTDLLIELGQPPKRPGRRPQLSKQVAHLIKLIEGADYEQTQSYTQHELLETCNRILELAAYRNDRVHAQLSASACFVGDLTLYNFADGKPLSMDIDELKAKTRETCEIVVSKFWLVASEIKTSKQWEETLKQIFAEMDQLQ